MNTTVLVTGGLGFIGSHFVRLLLRERPEVRVVNLDKVTYAGNPENLADVVPHPNYTFVRGDIADRTLVDRVFRDNRPGIVVNFAAESHVDRSILDPGPFIQTNILGVQALLEAARQHRPDRYIQISTDEVYGDIPQEEPPAEEDATLRPSSPYSASKAAADLLCFAYARTYGLPILVVRPSNNYGPNQFPEKLIPLMIRNALAGQHLPVYGDGKQRRDWLHVGDNVRGILRVIERGSVGNAYNVATGTETENVEVVNHICAILAQETGQPLDRLRGLVRPVTDRPGHDRRYAARPTRMREELEWEPAHQFLDGLKQTIRWYLSNAAWLERVVTGEYRRYYEMVYTRSWNETRG